MLKSRLTSMKIQKLETIGFEWALSGRELWEKRFHELVAYRKEVSNLVLPNIIHFELVLSSCFSACTIWYFTERELQLSDQVDR